MSLAFIPSPSQGVWHLGPFPIRAYALCILAGVIVAVWVGDRRWVARGGRPGTVADVAIWMVPFGLVGARLYHVITDPELYFKAGENPWAAFFIWRGGLGIWGGIALGALGAYIACRRRRIKFAAFADALAPAIVLGQAIGRWGNYFNQELFGRPTTLPWGLKIAPEHRPPGFAQYATFHPTFLYESIWDLGTAGFVIWLDRRFKLGHGRAFALYVMAYTAGRGWIEYMRIDTVNHLLGLRLNVWTSIILFVLAAAYFVVVGRRHPGRETDVEPGSVPATAAHRRATAGGEPEPAAPAAQPDAAAQPGPTTSPTGATVPKPGTTTSPPDATAAPDATTPPRSDSPSQ